MNKSHILLVVDGCHHSDMCDLSFFPAGSEEYEVSGLQIFHIDLLADFALISGASGEADVDGIESVDEQARTIHA